MDAMGVLKEDRDVAEAVTREPPAVEEDEVSLAIGAECLVNERAPAVLERLRNLRQSSSWCAR